MTFRELDIMYRNKELVTFDDVQAYLSELRKLSRLGKYTLDYRDIQNIMDVVSMLELELMGGNAETAHRMIYERKCK